MLHTMKTKPICTGLLAAAALAAGCATHDHMAGRTAVGTVAGVYVEKQPGVYVDRRLTRAAEGKRVWVEVSFASPLADGRDSATALAPDPLDVQHGDSVEVRFADSAFRSHELLPVHDTVVAIAARHAVPGASAQSSTARPAAADALARSNTPQN